MKIHKLVYKSGIEYRNENNQLHREDGPAIELETGTKSWYQNGKLHRTDGPAIESASGDEFWFQDGKCHRLDGPAIEYANGDKEWYFNGKQNCFRDEDILRKILQKPLNIKKFIVKNIRKLDPGEAFLIRLVIKNHFPDYINFLDNLLVLQ